VRSLAVSVLASLLAAGCSVTVDANRKQCATDSDCVHRGDAFASSVCVHSFCEPEPKWGCVGVPAETKHAPEPFHVSLRVVDILTQEPMPGVSALLCRKIDVTCDSPFGPAVLSDDDGKVEFDVTRDAAGFGFTGYVRFTRDDVLPGIYIFNPAIESDLTIPSVQLASPTVAGLLAQQIGTKLDPARGLILLDSVDCQGAPAAGVSFMTDADDTAAPFYSVNGLPAATATATDDDGYGGLINVQPGTIAVTGKLQPKASALGTVSLLIRGGAVTYSRMVPAGE
jgi:hypothetical protein